MNRLSGLKKYYHQYERSKHLEKLAELTKETNQVISTSISTLNNEAGGNYSVLVGDLLKNFLNNWLEYAMESWQSEVIFLIFPIHQLDCSLKFERISRYNGASKYSMIRTQ